MPSEAAGGGSLGVARERPAMAHGDAKMRRGGAKMRRGRRMTLSRTAGPPAMRPALTGL
jgi:hypothetical protein